MHLTAGLRGVLLIAGVAGLFGAAASAERTDESLPTIEEVTRGLEERAAGLADLYVDRAAGRVWLELPAAAAGGDELARFLYAEGLLAGLGSNPVGLDRGELGRTRLIVFRRAGGRVLVVEPNLRYRALGASAAERRAVDHSFATSVLWAADIAARSADGRTLIDLTSFIVRDAHGVVARLEAAGQGKFELDVARSAVELDACLAFPENLELETLLTYAGKDPGSHVRGVTPTPRAITLVQHHSLLRLPDSGYRPRVFDPRAGSSAIRFMDYATALDRPLERRWIVRHRLDKVDPRKARSRVRQPLVYYVDPGAPEPVRSALVEGASWWAEAFEAAGFIDAFRVELLPPEAHPLDARYNVIQWVHRSTRGWSYGGGVIDPRTGEMIKGHVRLGSLRVRQDRLLFEGLLGVGQDGSGPAIEPALARLRQLAAHEVGHTLGLAHNFAASTYAGRASVMDYPAPMVRIDAEGRLDLSEAYAVGVGRWDLHAVRYAYSQFAPGADEAVELRRIVRQGAERGLLFLSDEDARPAGAAHPLANLWDNGDDPVEELQRMLEVRRVALERFGERNIAVGRPLALLEEALATLYFNHRYQLTAAAKSLAGLEYSYAARGEPEAIVRPVAAARQRRALQTLLEALSSERLDLPESILELLHPRPFGYLPNREMFDGAMRPGFDGLAAAASAAGLVVSELLQPQRCARLVDQERRTAGRLPGLGEVLDALVEATFAPAPGLPARLLEIRRTVQQVVARGLVELSSEPEASPAVRARVDLALDDLLQRIDADTARRSDRAREAQLRYLGAEIRRYLVRPRQPTGAPAVAPPAPPGSPIGAPAEAWAGGCSQY